MLDEPYIAEEQLAAGPSGIVYRGFDLAHSRTVRLKVLLEHHVSCPVDRPTIHAYAPHLLQLAHPNVCSLLELDVKGDEVTLISEFAEGANGWAFVHGGSLSGHEAHILTGQLLQALDQGNFWHVPHGNVKPSNLVLTRQVNSEIRLKLLDWGLSHCRSHQPHETLAMRAPECLRGGVATNQSDLFSAGATMAALLLGRLPVMGLNEAALHAAWLRFDPDELRFLRPDVNSAWMDVLLALLHPDPEQRPASATQAVEQFAAAAKHTSGLHPGTFNQGRPQNIAAEPHSDREAPPPTLTTGPHRFVRWLGVRLVVAGMALAVVVWMVNHRDAQWPPGVVKSMDQVEAVWQRALEKFYALKNEFRS